MKKALLLAATVFIAVFALWPTTAYNYDDCPDTGILDNIMYECAPPRTFESFGGGIKYIARVIGDGSLMPDGNTKIQLQMLGYSYFQPLHASGAALVLAGLAGSACFIILRQLGKSSR